MLTPAGSVERAAAASTNTEYFRFPIADLGSFRQRQIGNRQSAMTMSATVSHYCQKCLAANPLGTEFCTRCGTRLMIVVEPNSSRYEAGPASISTDEHLLERISASENRVARLAERLERSLDLLLRYAQNAYFDRSLIRALVSLLTEDGVVETERLEQMWSDRCQRDTIEQEENVHRDTLRLRIIASAHVPDKEVFEDLVNEGFVLIEDKQIPQGITKLQAAADIAEE